MIKRTKKILTSSIFKTLLRLAFPIIIANLLQSTYHLTDSFWLGRLGASALAAVSIASPIIYFTFTLGLGFAVAGSTFVAQYFGAKNQKMLSHAAAQTILMIIITSFLFSIIGYIFAPQILTLMGANQEIFADALSFVRISFLAIIFNFTFFIFQAIMRAISRPKLPVVIVTLTVLLNFFLDPLFIFGWKSIPAFGVKGAVFATISTQSLASLIAIIILFSGKHGIHLKLKNFIPDLSFIKRAFLVGLPSSIGHSSRNLAMVFMASIVASFGTIAVASYGAASNIIQLPIFVGLALATANATLVGQNLGARNIPQAIRVSKLSAALSSAIILSLSVVTFIFAKHFISFFIPSDPQVIAQGTTILRIISPTFAFMALQMSFGHVFVAAGQTQVTMFLNIISQWLIQIPFAFFLSRHTQLASNGIWFAMVIANVITAIIAFLLYKKGSWQKSKIINEDEIKTELSEENLVD